MNSDNNRYVVLDGWRGLSILFVLAAHLLPLGPKILKLNAASGVFGMSLFFCLSGFLIARFFLDSSDTKQFFMRRFERILPLAWLGLVIAYLFYELPFRHLMWNMLFLANWPPMHLTDVIAHYWSLCVEMQYYLFIGFAFYFLRQRYVYVILIACFAVTAYRMINGVEVAINTYYRVDEILAGSLLLFAITGRSSAHAKRFLAWLNPLFPLVCLALASHDFGGWMNYFRPYFAAMLVGSTLCKNVGFWRRFLSWRALGYLAATSYALYVIHPFLVHTWLGEGETIEKYLKRPLLFISLFFLAHLSTFYYEKAFINWSRKKKSNKHNPEVEK